MYEAFSDYQNMMDMAERIVTGCAMAVNGKLTLDYQVSMEIINSSEFYVLW